MNSRRQPCSTGADTTQELNEAHAQVGSDADQPSDRLIYFCFDNADG